jgi:hypothetical protein
MIFFVYPNPNLALPKRLREGEGEAKNRRSQWNSGEELDEVKIILL